MRNFKTGEYLQVFKVMSSALAAATIGKGGPDLDLSRDELRSMVEEALSDISPNARVLAIISDKTRDDNTDVLFPVCRGDFGCTQRCAL